MMIKNPGYKKFIMRLFAFLYPFILLFLFSFFMLVSAKEIISLESIVKLHDSKDRFLIGLSYTNPCKVYKLRVVLEKRRDIIALGSSRVMQFRSGFFKGGTKFYNAGGCAEKIGHFIPFLNSLPDERVPKVLIVGLDQYFFNAAWDDGKPDDILERFADRHFWTKAVSCGAVNFYSDYYRGKFRFRNIVGSLKGLPGNGLYRIGLNAIANENGYLGDGSYYYGKIFNNPGRPDCHHDFNFSDTFSRIERGADRFEYGSEVSQRAVTALDGFLKECARRKIHVAGFLPPFADGAVAKMRSMGRKYAYMEKIGPAVKPLFLKHGFTFFDFTELKSVGSCDREMIDGFHGSDKTYLRLFLKMAAGDPVIAGYADLISLKQRLDSSDHDFLIFRGDEN